MIDGTPLYPDGFHPSDQGLDLKGLNEAMHIRRIVASTPVKYYFVDFGLSTFRDPSNPRRAIGRDGADQEVPELSETEEYDLFPLDVFILGNVYRKSLLDVGLFLTLLCVCTAKIVCLLQVYTNLEFLRTLVESMVCKNPAERTSSSEALRRFKAIAATKKGSASRWRLRDKSESYCERVVGDTRAVCREVLHITARIVSFPKRLGRYILSVLSSTAEDTSSR